MLKYAHIWSTDAALMRAVAVARRAKQSKVTNSHRRHGKKKLRRAVELATDGQ
jgi:hypothetical protein